MADRDVEHLHGRIRAAASSALVTLLVVLAMAPVAGAASIAYIDGGEVWVSSLDGGQKARLGTPVVDGGSTRQWLAVAASDSGRIVAVREGPGPDSRLRRFKVWEPDGSSTVDAPLGAPVGYASYDYPLGLDITADGSHLAYGYTNTSACCPESVDSGTYVRPATNSVLDPTVLAGRENPTLLGSRVIARLGQQVDVQAASGAPNGATFTAWFDASGSGLDLRRTDVAANGQLAALERGQWSAGSQTAGAIGLLAIQGVDQTPAFPASVDCTLPASGLAREPSLSPDATRIAWTDGQGLKVAGTPTGAADPCQLTSAPVVISPTASQGSIGGANVAAFMPPAPVDEPPGDQPAPGGQTAGEQPIGAPLPEAPAPSTLAAPVASVPARLTTKALARRRGVSIRVRVGRAGRVTISGKVPAKVLRRRGPPVLVVTGAATARRAGIVTVTVRLTAVARRQRRRLKGARMTLRVSQGGVSSTLRRTLR